MDEKAMTQSKTFWTNVLGSIAMMAAAANLDIGLTPEVQNSIAIGLVAIFNVVMRAVSHARITSFFKQE